MTSTRVKNKRVEKTANASDNVTNVHFDTSKCALKLAGVFSGVRKSTGVRVDSGLWRWFRAACRSRGLSTCSVLEALIVGWGGGLESGVRSAPVTVVVDLPRVVKRVRRRQIYFEDEVAVKESKPDDVQATVFCQFCFREAVGMAEHKKSGIKAFVCEKHGEELEKHPKWRVIKESGLEK